MLTGITATMRIVDQRSGAVVAEKGEKLTPHQLEYALTVLVAEEELYNSSGKCLFVHGSGA